MVGAVHHQLHGPPCLPRQRNSLERQMGNQLLASVGTAGMACDHPHGYARNGRLGIEFLKVGRAAVVVQVTALGLVHCA